MELRKFVIKLSIFVSFILLFFLVLESLIRKIPNDYKLKLQLIENYRDSIETVGLGNSHARDGLNPEFFDSFTINLANSAQPLKYDLELLKLMLKKGNNIKNVILPISYFSMYFNLDESPSHYLNKNYSIYMGFNVSRIKYHTEVFSGLSLRTQFGRVLDYYILGNRVRDNELRGFSESNYIVDIISLKDNSKVTAARQNEYVVNGQVNYLENLEILNNIITLVNEYDLHLILFSPPFHSEFVSMIDAKFLNENLQFCDSIDNQYENIKFFDFTKDSQFQTSDFKNESHLNSFGAKKLSIELNKICNSFK